MKDRQPWSVRGVTREARAKAARAAAQRHLTIGEWVTQVLVAAADRDLGVAAEQPAAEAKANVPATGGHTDNELAGAIGALVQHLQKSTPEVQASDIARRLELTEHALVGRMEQMAAGLYSLMQTMETRAMPVIDGNDRNDRPIMLPDNSRLADAVEKMASAEGRRQDQMAAVAEALTLLAAKVDHSGSQAPSARRGDDDNGDDDDTKQTETTSTEDDEDKDECADAESEPSSRTAAAARIAAAPDERRDDVIAAIRARGTKSPELDDSRAQQRRGLLNRLFGRD